MSRRASAPFCQEKDAAAHGLPNHFIVVHLSSGTLPGMSAAAGLYTDAPQRANGEPNGKRRTAGRTARAHEHGSGPEALQAAQPNGGVKLCRHEGTPRPAAVPWPRIETGYDRTWLSGPEPQCL